MISFWNTCLIRGTTWKRVGHLKVVLGVWIAVLVFSLWVDIIYFPDSVTTDATDLFWRSIMLAYFSKSKRVARVFKKPGEKEATGVDLIQF